MDRFEQLLHDDFWGDDYWNVCECKEMLADVIAKKCLKIIFLICSNQGVANALGLLNTIWEIH